jgi:hypothetical protein
LTEALEVNGGISARVQQKFSELLSGLEKRRSVLIISFQFPTSLELNAPEEQDVL